MISNCKIIGNIGEDTFTKQAKSRGYTTVKALKEQDMYGHYDIIISKDDKSFKVDVKGLKRKYRDGPIITDEMWIEFYNVRGALGWIYGSGDWIAQQTDTSTFYIFDRTDLIKQINPLVKWNLPVVKSPSQALYRLYQRWNRQDIVTKIKLEDVKPLYIWK